MIKKNVFPKKYSSLTVDFLYAYSCQNSEKNFNNRSLIPAWTFPGFDNILLLKNQYSNKNCFRNIFFPFTKKQVLFGKIIVAILKRKLKFIIFLLNFKLTVKITDPRILKKSNPK